MKHVLMYEAYLGPKLVLLLNLGQQCNQPGLRCLGPHKAADGHSVLGQHGLMEGNEGLGAAWHGPLIWVQEGGAAQLVILLQHGCGLEAQQPQAYRASTSLSGWHSNG